MSLAPVYCIAKIRGLCGCPSSFKGDSIDSTTIQPWQGHSFCILNLISSLNPSFKEIPCAFATSFFLLVQQLPVKEPRCGMILQTSGKAEVEATLRVLWEAQARRRATTFEKRLGCAPSESSEVTAPKPELSKCTKNHLWNIKQLKWQGIWNESAQKQVTNTNKPSFRNASFICDSVSITAHWWLRCWYHMS